MNAVILSSLTLDQELISKDQDSKESCDWFSKEKSKRLWLSTETDFVDLDAISWNGYSNIVA